MQLLISAIGRTTIHARPFLPIWLQICDCCFLGLAQMYNLRFVPRWEGFSCPGKVVNPGYYHRKGGYCTVACTFPILDHIRVLLFEFQTGVVPSIQHDAKNMKFHTMQNFPTIQYDLLNCYISKVFSNSGQNLTPFDPPVLHSPPPKLSEISCSEDKVFHLLSSILWQISSGPDGISSGMLQGSATAIASSLTQLFNKSLSLGQVCTQRWWPHTCLNKSAHFLTVTTIKTSRENCAQKAPISLTHKLTSVKLLLGHLILAQWLGGFTLTPLLVCAKLVYIYIYIK